MVGEQPFGHTHIMEKKMNEIRTKVLEIAKDMEQFEFHAKFAGWEQTVTRDPSTGEIITSVEMPKVPTADEVLASAQKFYDFINNASTGKKKLLTNQ